jgi:hypothetical protein
MASKVGFFGWLWSGKLRLFFLGILLCLMIALLCWSAYQPVWQLLLAAECAAVCFGIDFGWCLVKFDRSRLAGVDMKKDLDQLGFFNSRIAMRSPELFNITIADLDEVTPDDKAKARALVRKHWEPKADESTIANPKLEK